MHRSVVAGRSPVERVCQLFRCPKDRPWVPIAIRIMCIIIAGNFSNWDWDNNDRPGAVKRYNPLGIPNVTLSVLLRWSRLILCHLIFQVQLFQSMQCEAIASRKLSQCAIPETKKNRIRWTPSSLPSLHFWSLRADTAVQFRSISLALNENNSTVWRPKIILKRNRMQ